MSIAILSSMVVITALLGIILFKVIADTPDRDELARLKNRDEDFQKASEELRLKVGQIEKLREEKARLESDLDNERRGSEEKITLLKDAEQRLTTVFENSAGKILGDKGKAISNENRLELDNILKPFKEQLESFRKRVDQIHNDGTTQSTALLSEVKHLHSLSNKISDEANNLAKAIKGQSKVQGDWGEIIVERVLEASGLTKDREYKKQVGLRDEDGSLLKPDFVVYLPGDRSVILDSKVSLKAFEQYCSSETESERTKALGEHIQSVRSHFEGLVGKNYDDLLGNRTLDFVLMCIPLEPAYQLALQADPDLLYDLAKSKVVITGPTTLMITMKLIAQLWRREYENKNSAVIADKAGKLYDQVVLVYEVLKELGDCLGKADKIYETAVKRLWDGKGNLVGRVEELKVLGAKVSRQYPKEILEQATVEIGCDEIPEDDRKEE